ncbi:UDP-N-acetylmuramate-alanine ligase [Synechococcus sp. A18-40]|nr:UDP-N-acetylmuramate-alanine ligase [Synechococcus sp. A18-40]
MSALAKILVDRGHPVSGSDPRDTPTSHQLTQLGVTVVHEQTEATIETLLSNGRRPIVVVSTAIPTSNPELRRARDAGLEIWHRSDLLAALIDQQASIAVAGSHGKTTTSTLITTLLMEAGEDPTAIIGGIVPCLGSNGHAGHGPLLVAEADESDGSLVKFRPQLGLITNLELDHTDHYDGLDDLINTMRLFADGCDQVLANRDCPILKEHIQPDAWWSVTSANGVDFAALPLQLDGDRCLARFCENGAPVGDFMLPLPGLHNLSNAAGALAACRMEGIPFERLVNGLTALKPPGRRFDLRGTWEGRHIVDDYAHHPSEVKATLAMAQLMVSSGRSPLPSPPQRLLAVFQPHRYSRTQEFLESFASALQNCDSLLLAPVYSAGEEPLKGVCSQSLADRIQVLKPDLEIAVADNLDHLTQLVRTRSRREDLVLAMGAGDVNGLWPRLAA